MEPRRRFCILIKIGILILYFGVYISSSKILSATLQKTNGTEFTAIVGGNYAKPGQLPFMAGVYTKGSFCGGCVISQRWILTAGHCVANSTHFFIILGSTIKPKMTADWKYDGDGIMMTTTKSVLHPQFHLGENDIALLHMPQNIEFGDTIQPITLSGVDYGTETFVEEKVVIAGWGVVGPRGISRHLKWGEITIISNDDCQSFWPVTPNQICTAPMTGSDTCKGDSGGPLILGTEDGFLLIGIVSFGDNNCPSSSPAVFSRVSSYANWIQQVEDDAMWL